MFKGARLIDVFLLGPIQILVGLLINDNIFLRLFMILTGILNIIYNGNNYLYFNYGVKPILSPFVNKKHGKTQIHRIYNLLVMYPIFYYIYQNYEMPSFIKTIFYWDIIIGALFNGFNLIKHLS